LPIKQGAARQRHALHPGAAPPPSHRREVLFHKRVVAHGQPVEQHRRLVDVLLLLGQVGLLFNGRTTVRSPDADVTREWGRGYGGGNMD
jgi:hypothetical protein